jgi:hypothetical protein
MIKKALVCVVVGVLSVGIGAALVPDHTGRISVSAHRLPDAKSTMRLAAIDSYMYFKDYDTSYDDSDG